MISDDSTIVASDNLTVADLEGEAVVLDQARGVYYGLNKMGTRILALIEEPVTVRSILQSLVEEYPETPRGDIKTDLHGFLTKIHENNLITVIDANSSG